MIIPHCSTLTWQKLYAAAESFREIGCWDWMSDSDLFGVENPVDGEIGYCCVLGELGETYGLVVYLGSLGLEQHRKIQSGRMTARSRDFVRSQSCLTAWFGDRGDLDDTDLKIVKALGLKFRGRNTWPQFRSLRPGYLPWYLCESEARFLAVCLEQARHVALDFARAPDLLDPPAKKHYFVRVPREPSAAHAQDKSSGTDQRLFPEAGSAPHDEWKTQWRAAEPLVKRPVKPFPLNEIQLQRIKKTGRRYDGAWESDGFFTAQPLAGEERPFFPYAFLCADQDSGFIFSTVLAEWKTWETEFPKALLAGIEEHGLFPEKLRVRKKEFAELFAPLAARLGIEIELCKRLPSVEHARRALFKFMEKRF
jgi:hypothetical protein